MYNIVATLRRKLDGIAMYRTVTLALSGLALFSITFGILGLIPYSGPEQIISLFISLLVALSTNIICSRLWKIEVNNESALITALILFFLIIPAQLSSPSDLSQIATVTFLAIISKFVFTWKKQHLVNPAAVGIVILALAYEIFPIPGYFESAWWVGQRELFIPLLIFGLMVVSKVRKFVPVMSFLVVGFIVFLFEEWKFGMDLAEGAPRYFIAGPSLFLAFFMLTEPFTMPPTKKLQCLYGSLIGFISQTTLFATFLNIKMTPELALVVGNLLMYPTTLKQKLILPLIEKRELAKNTFEFSFQKPASLSYKAGQYLEWMLPHKNFDNRGIRRYFTISSAPTENVLKVAVRFAEPSSSYKKSLLKMNSGEVVIASQLAGDFILPKKAGAKLGFIAGGIGITPFISHIRFMENSENKHDTVLFNCNNTLEEVAYKSELDEAKENLHLKVVNVLAKENIPPHESGYLTADIIKRHAPDFLEREWYLSGPPGMVNSYFKMLQELGVARSKIKRDFFPGLA